MGRFFPGLMLVVTKLFPGHRQICSHGRLAIVTALCVPFRHVTYKEITSDDKTVILCLNVSRPILLLKDLASRSSE